MGHVVSEPDPEVSEQFAGQSTIIKIDTPYMTVVGAANGEGIWAFAVGSPAIGFSVTKQEVQTVSINEIAK